MKTTAQSITQRMEAEGRTRSKDSIYTVVSDDHNVLCMTEALLDTWWAFLQPEHKAALYELHLEGILENVNACVYCGCTDLAACPGGCSWVDLAHTVCSTPPCVAKHRAAQLSGLATRPLPEALTRVLDTAPALHRSMLAEARQTLANLAVMASTSDHMQTAQGLLAKATR